MKHRCSSGLATEFSRKYTSQFNLRFDFPINVAFIRGPGPARGWASVSLVACGGRVVFHKGAGFGYYGVP
jgi:hypothetical protein